MRNKPKIAIITNIPAPYRVLMYNGFAEFSEFEIHVFYCGKTQRNRSWKVENIKHNHTFLKDKSVFIGGRHIYFDFSIIKQLKLYNPDVVITNMFNPPMLMAWLYAFIKRKKHVVLTDSWLKTINTLSWVHKSVRKVLFRYTHAYLAIGKKCKEFLFAYKVSENKIFNCPLTIDIPFYKQYIQKEKRYDIMFSGQFIERKMPFFFCDVINTLKDKGVAPKVLVIGNGPLKGEFLNKLTELQIDFDYPGFISQQQLPLYYSLTKIFLMPTKIDHWGLVANEAMAVGTPVITCDNAGAANDLVLHKRNGYVLPLDKNVWAEHIIKLLANADLYDSYSSSAIEHIDSFSIEVALRNFEEMICYLKKE